MSAWAAFRDGVRRVNSAPLVLCGLVLVTLIAAPLLSLAFAGDTAGERGPRAASGRVRGHADLHWWVSAQISGLESMPTPSVSGVVAFLQEGDGPASHQPARGPIALVAVAWLVVWSFMSGGILDRYARQRPAGADRFLAACAAHVGRLLRLGMLAAAVWLLVFALHAWLVGGPSAPGTTERTAYAIRLPAHLLSAVLVAAAAVLFDYARVRIVVEDRRSAIGAVAAAVRFVTRRTRAVCGLFLLNMLALVVTITVYLALSAGTARADMHTWLVLALGQTYIVARHYLKLLVYASATALFQGGAAHADDAAAPVLMWPESPEVEPLTGTEASPAR